MFDLDALERAVVRHIDGFAAAHSGATFAAFAIDADLLCLNTEDELEAILAHLRKEHGGAVPPEIADAARRETGDYAYQGFAQLGPQDGFDRDAYRAHYDLDDAGQRTSTYGVAMDELLLRLVARGAFDRLRRTPDFLVIRVEHGY